MPLPSWSHSRIVDFESCKFKAFLKYDQRIPEPERPLPPGKTEHANDRGTRVHDAAERYVRGEIDDLIPELHTFAPEFIRLRGLFPSGAVHLEGEWGMDKNWEPCDWRTAWLRLKIDSLTFLTPYEAVVVDYKTGKRWGNEIKHTEQTQLYALNTALRHPTLEVIHTELWYTDLDELHAITYERHQALRFRDRWHKRGVAMTTATDFPANPNIFSCKWCPYGPKGTGHCERGVQK